MFGQLKELNEMYRKITEAARSCEKGKVAIKIPGGAAWTANSCSGSLLTLIIFDQTAGGVRGTELAARLAQAGNIKLYPVGKADWTKWIPIFKVTHFLFGA